MGLLYELPQDPTVWLSDVHHGRRGERRMVNNEYRAPERYSNTYIGDGLSIHGSVLGVGDYAVLTRMLKQDIDPRRKPRGDGGV